MATLEQVLRNFEDRIAALEGALQAKGDLPPSYTPPTPKVEIKVAPPPEKKDSTPFLLGVVGIIFLILAGAFFIKLTLDSGWLTPERQIILSTLTGLVIMSLPHFNLAFADNYGSLLSGTGVVILHLSWFGAFKIHGLIPMNTALMLSTLVGVLSILMNAKHANAIFVLVAIAGTYLSAPLMDYSDAIGSVSAFMLVWNISFCALAIEGKRRDVLLVAAYFAFFSCGLLMIDAKVMANPEMAYHLLILQVVQAVIFAAATMVYTLRHQEPMSREQGWALFPLLLIFYILTNMLVSVVLPAFYPFYGLVVGLFVLGAYHFVAARSKTDLASAPPVSAFAILVIAHSVYFNLAPVSVQPFLSLAIALGVGVLLRKTGPVPKAWKPALFILFALGIYGILLGFDLPVDSMNGLALSFAWGLMALGLLPSAGLQEGSRKKMLLMFAHIEMLEGFYRLNKYMQWNLVALSLTWGLYAFATLLWANQRKDRALGQSAVLILTTLSLKVAFFDLWGADDLKRIGSLVIAGVLLYSCGWIYRKIKTWP